MHVSIRAFASYKDAIGAPRVSVDVPPGSTAAQVWEDLLVRYPRLLELPRPFAFAINDEYIPGETPLRERDELVLIPPVSGGAHIALVETPIRHPGPAPRSQPSPRRRRCLVLGDRP